VLAVTEICSKSLERLKEVEACTYIIELGNLTLRVPLDVAKEALTNMLSSEDERFTFEQDALPQLSRVEMGKNLLKKQAIKVTKEVIQHYLKFLALKPAPRDTSEYQCQVIMNTKICPSNPMFISVGGERFDAKVDYEKIGPNTWTASCSPEMRYLDFLLETQNQNLQVVVEAAVSIVRSFWLDWLNKLHRAIKKLDKSAKLAKKYKVVLPVMPSIRDQLAILNTSIANDLSKFAFSRNRLKPEFEDHKEDSTMRKAIRSQNFLFCRVVDPTKDNPLTIFDFSSKWFESKKLSILEKSRIIHAAIVIQRSWRSLKRKAV